MPFLCLSNHFCFLGSKKNLASRNRSSNSRFIFFKKMQMPFSSVLSYVWFSSWYNLANFAVCSSLALVEQSRWHFSNFSSTWWYFGNSNNFGTKFLRFRWPFGFPSNWNGLQDDFLQFIFPLPQPLQWCGEQILRPPCSPCCIFGTPNVLEYEISNEQDIWFDVSPNGWIIHFTNCLSTAFSTKNQFCWNSHFWQNCR